MACLRTEMRDIDDGGGIVGHDLQHLARCQRLQPLARFQHGQGAQEPGGVEFGVMIHEDDVFATRGDVDAANLLTFAKLRR